MMTAMVRMKGPEVAAHLRELCRRIDRARAIAAAVAVPAAIALSACGTSQGTTEELPPAQELLHDGVDNDGDGLADCADPDCVDMESCVAGLAKEDVPMYGVPFEPEPIALADPEPCVPQDR